MTTVQELARRFADLFVTDTRVDGQTFRKTVDDRPEELEDLIYKAHGDMFPDDWKYEFIYEALESIAESEDPDSPDLEADIYNSDRLRWLSSKLDRSGYVDEYVEDFGIDASNFNLIELIGAGQLKEKEEVYYSVLSSLQELADADDVDEFEDDEE